MRAKDTEMCSTALTDITCLSINRFDSIWSAAPRSPSPRTLARSLANAPCFILLVRCRAVVCCCCCCCRRRRRRCGCSYCCCCMYVCMLLSSSLLLLLLRCSWSGYAAPRGSSLRVPTAHLRRHGPRRCWRRRLRAGRHGSHLRGFSVRPGGAAVRHGRNRRSIRLSVGG